MPSTYASASSAAGGILGKLLGDSGYGADELKYQDAGASAALRGVQAQKYQAEAQKITDELRRTNEAWGMTGADVAGDLLGIAPELYAAAKEGARTGGAAYGSRAQSIDPAWAFDDADAAALDRTVNTITTRPAALTPEVERGVRQADLLVRLNKLGGGDSNAQQLMQALLGGQQLTLGQDMETGKIGRDTVAGIMAAMAGKETYSQGAHGVLNQYSGDIAPTANSRAAVTSEYALARERDAHAGLYDTDRIAKQRESDRLQLWADEMDAGITDPLSVAQEQGALEGNYSFTPSGGGPGNRKVDTDRYLGPDGTRYLVVDDGTGVLKYKNEDTGEDIERLPRNAVQEYVVNSDTTGRFGRENRIYTQTAKEAEPIVKVKLALDQLEDTIAAGGEASTADITRLLAAITPSDVRALADQNLSSNPGGLWTRTVGALSKLTTGEFSNTQINEVIKPYIRELRENFVNQSLREIRQRARQRAASDQHVDPARAVPDFGVPDAPATSAPASAPAAGQPPGRVTLRYTGGPP